MDAGTAIANDHRAIEKLLDGLLLADGGGGERRLLVELGDHLRAHCVAEEAHAYRALVNEDPRERSAVYVAIGEHRTAVVKLAATARACGTPGFGEARGDLVEVVVGHIERCESQILPALRDRTTTTWHEELGRLFEQRRAAELGRCQDRRSVPERSAAQSHPVRVSRMSRAAGDR